MTWWVVIVTIAVVAVLVIGVVAFRAVRAEGSDTAERREQTPDEMFMLGVVFLGSGIALFIAVGPAMLGLPILGAIFMAMGARRKREQDEGR